MRRDATHRVLSTFRAAHHNMDSPLLLHRREKTAVDSLHEIAVKLLLAVEPDYVWDPLHAQRLMRGSDLDVLPEVVVGAELPSLFDRLRYRGDLGGARRRRRDDFHLEVAAYHRLSFESGVCVLQVIYYS